MTSLPKRDNCIFCSIVEGNTTEIFYEDDECIAFKDNKPAATHHYLIIPKQHIGNPSTLQASAIDLIKHMMDAGKSVLENKIADITDARFGFHWPPFNTVQHLHLHVISPVSEMGFMSRLIFRPDSYWFVTASSLIEKLEKIEGNKTKS